MESAVQRKAPGVLCGSRKIKREKRERQGEVKERNKEKWKK